MGIIRTLLALAVVAYHSKPILGLNSVNGVLAVELFYVISGFYMALVLSEKYGPDTRRFYRARALRIYPVYWIVLAATILAGALIGGPFPGRLNVWIAEWRQLGILELLTLVLSNIALFGQGLLQFFSVDNGHFAFDWAHPAPRIAGHYFVIHPAWTLGLELTFYLMAPWFVRLSTLWLAGIMALSIGARVIALRPGLDFDPWTYRFFPFELALFAAGMLSYRLFRYAKPVLQTNAWQAFGWGVVAVVAVLVASHGTELWNARWLSIGLVALALPFLFAASRRSKVDALIGELSYPVYIVHASIIAFAGGLASHRDFGLLMALASIFGALMLLLLTLPIERRRSASRVASAAA